MPTNRSRIVPEPIARCSQPPFRHALIHDSARWIADRRWDAFATLTFENEVDEPTAAREFERYVRRLEQRSLGRVRYFAVAAKSPAFGRVHVHAVIGFRRQPSASARRRAWLAGIATIERFEAGRGGDRYIASHVPIPGAEVLFRP
jgi:hypothetical protein